MLSTQNTVLGISLGTKRIGIAVAKQEHLLEWQIKAFDTKWSEAKLRVILTSLEEIIRQYQVSEIALKVPHANRCSQGLKVLTQKVMCSAQRNGIPIITFSIKSIKMYWCPGKGSSRKQLMETVVAKYPELTHRYRRAHKSKYAYHFKLFEAVALTEMTRKK